MNLFRLELCLLEKASRAWEQKPLPLTVSPLRSHLRRTPPPSPTRPRQTGRPSPVQVPLHFYSCDFLFLAWDSTSNMILPAAVGRFFEGVSGLSFVAYTLVAQTSESTNSPNIGSGRFWEICLVAVPPVSMIPGLSCRFVDRWRVPGTCEEGELLDLFDIK